MAGDKNGGLPLPVQAQQQFPKLHDTLRIQTVDGLNQQEKFRLVHKRQGQAKALLHAQGEGLKLLFPCVGEVHQLQGLIHAVFARDAPLDAVVLQILPGGEVWVEGGNLHHGAGAAAGAVQSGVGGLPKQGDLAGGGNTLAGDQADEGSFARAVSAYQAKDLALLYRDAGPVQGQGVAVAPGQLLSL